MLLNLFINIKFKIKTLTLPLSQTKLDTLSNLYQYKSLENFPEVANLIQILMTHPVTSCEAERSFSTLRRLMTWMRSTMGSGRLCNLARMHMHSDILDQVSNEEILKQFVQQKPRILEFGGSIIKAFNYFLLINLNGMLFLIRFLCFKTAAC